jgi:hypothetical protein
METGHTWARFEKLTGSVAVGNDKFFSQRGGEPISGHAMVALKNDAWLPAGPSR